MRKSLVALSVLAATALPSVVNAADYSDDIHKNDYKWINFNLMYALGELPRPDGAHSGHDYLEMEFGGRSGIFDLYGYVDVFNLTNRDSSDKYQKEKIFMKFAPRISLDALTGKDLSFGPVQELYIATLFNWGGGYTVDGFDPNKGAFDPVNNYFVGIGSDVNVPWLGKVGLNLYSLYDMNKKDWNGYQISTNWFKPFYTFANGSFLSYQGYIDYQFGMKDKYSSASNGGAMFNGLYWHSERFAVGYGLKAYYNVYGIKDTSNLETTGVSHYFDITYKF
ncbi:TPA: outer membrane protein OmpK [Photobacterium damselae]|uniref:nucleoside-specific channel-forming Tsx family protein n=1 Tax=Photobacterium damselae TaxID=38293 RepID=UPI001F48CB88|nr:outer membrane protein OmpK [Photobacterium damselae]MCG9776942.1 outer membrane protein OmpK [Photobacterium damselae]UKA05705.1 outer membrane protein OmpK [Photobacterium damselae subsp. damselae]UKA20811.1 outer membrane protein OmpK [Photobacterium damselae subsp. damselae]